MVEHFARRAATGRERRARVSHRDQARKIGKARIIVAAMLRWWSRNVLHRRAAPFRSRLCGCRHQARSRASVLTRNPKTFLSFDVALSKNHANLSVSFSPESRETAQ
jgi:hypothetical protein